MKTIVVTRLRTVNEGTRTGLTMTSGDVTKTQHNIAKFLKGHFCGTTCQCSKYFSLFVNYFIFNYLIFTEVHKNDFDVNVCSVLWAETDTWSGTFSALTCSRRVVVERSLLPVMLCGLIESCSFSVSLFFGWIKSKRFFSSGRIWIWTWFTFTFTSYSRIFCWFYIFKWRYFSFGADVINVSNPYL